MTLCVLMLVIGQVGLIQHQLDHDEHVRGNMCTVCLAAHSLGSALPSSATMPLGVAGISAPPDTVPVTVPFSRTPARLVARSPPAATIQA